MEIRRYIQQHHGIALSDPRFLPIYLALGTLAAIFVSVTVWSVLILTVFAQFNLRPLALVNQILAFAGIGIIVDFHKHKNLFRLLGCTVLQAITIVTVVAWFLGPIVSGVVWLFDIPALAIFLLGLRRGIFAIGTAFLSVGLAFRFGIAHTFVADEVSILVGHTINVVGATCILVLQLYFYDSSRRAMQRELGKMNRDLQVSSTTDRLTGLFNRGKLDHALAFELSRSIRSAQPLSIILMDLDYFKQVNDAFGHSVGDDVLVGVAGLMREVSRDIDIVGRWGGEEFLLICTNTSQDGALALAERLRVLIDSHVFPVAGHITASMGVASLRLADDIRTLLVGADKALYRAKDAGRNQVQPRSDVE